MCRYTSLDRPSGVRYRTHYACLDCRLSPKHERRLTDQLAPVCTSCAHPMIDLGLDFKPPKRRDHGQWEKVRRLVAKGITFDSCGCQGPGPRPKTLAGLKHGY